jgi:uncharacterized Zn finger protein
MKPTHLKDLHTKSKTLDVRLIKPPRHGEPYRAIVASGSALGHLVTIWFEPEGTIAATCTCPWAEHGGIGCKHVMAALSRLAELKQSTLSFWLTQEDARRQKRRVFRLVAAPAAADGLWITSRRPA